MLTWNMQGGMGTYGSKWQELSNRINNPGFYGFPAAPSIIFLQECSTVPNMITPPGWGPIPGAPPNVTRGSRNFGTYHNPNCYFVAHHAWGANSRVSFAVLISTAAIANPATHQQFSQDLSANIVVHNPVVAAAGTRPILGVTHGGATYYTMHAPSGVASGFSRTYISGMINAAFAGGPNYVIGGDFNCEPNTLYDAAHPIPAGSVLNTSGSVTYLNTLKEYDYFVSNNNALAGTALNNEAITNLISDHLGVIADY